jgi:DnaJ-class molecular chaperone
MTRPLTLFTNTGEAIDLERRCSHCNGDGTLKRPRIQLCPTCAGHGWEPNANAQALFTLLHQYQFQPEPSNLL